MENWKETLNNKRKDALPDFGPGDNLDVHYRVIEGDKERIQVFSGTVIQIKGAGADASFTVRKIAAGSIGVERIFPYHSPYISEITVKRRGSVRRAKLYYLRGKKGKAARVKEKVMR